MPPSTTTPAVLTVREVAEDLRCGKNQAYELIRAGQIRAVRIGRAIRVPAEALAAFKAGQVAESGVNAGRS
jgi:excisionase family DNA binding protein